MNTLRNKVSLIGRLGAQPEVVKLESGRSLTRFSIATNESFKNKDGEWKEKVTWHEINAWGKTADMVVKLLQKGHEVALDGQLVNNEYLSKTGEKRQSTKIIVRDFLLLTPLGDEKN